MQVARRPRLAAFEVGCPVVEHGVEIAVFSLGSVFQQRPGIALAQRPVEQCAGGALPTFAEPPAGQHRPVIRPPDARYHDRIGIDDHVAVRGATDDRQAAQWCGADQRQSAGVRVDDAGGDDDAGNQSERFGGLGAQRAGGRTEWQHLGRYLAEQVGQADGGKQCVTEAVLVRQVIPLAGQRAHAGDVGVGETPGQIIGEVEETPGLGIALGEMLLEPQDFGQLHLDADFAADVGQRRVVRGIECCRLRTGAVVHPHDDVALGFARFGDRDRLAVLADGNQRTRRIDADRGYLRRRNAGLGDRFAHGRAGLCPDVGRRLFDEQRLRMELLDRTDDKGQALTVRGKNAGPYAGRTDVDAQEYRCVHAPSVYRANSS